MTCVLYAASLVMLPEVECLSVLCSGEETGKELPELLQNDHWIHQKIQLL